MAKICVNLQAFQTYWNILNAFMEKAYKVCNPYLSTKFYQELCVIFNAKYKNGKKQNNLIARKTSH